MEVLIGLLLFIGAVTPGSEYTQSQINDLELQHQEEILEIQKDPVSIQQAETMYNQYGPAVLVLDEPIL